MGLSICINIDGLQQNAPKADTCAKSESDADVCREIQYARCNGVNIAVRTGGHQFSGASSTDAENIQLDMSETYKNKTIDFIVEEHDGAQTIVHVGISFSLFEFNTLMFDHGLFVSAGQCG